MDEDYTWATFVSAVLGMLGVNKARHGISEYRSALIRQGVIQIQGLIDEFRVGHETIYHPSDLVVEGYASRGVKPPEAVLRDVWLVALHSDGKSCYRYPVEQVDWKDRFALINGNASLNSGKALFAIDPQGYKFYIYPEVKDCWLISMWWEGLKLDFRDDDRTPFTEPMALAVADFVNAYIARQVDHDIALHDSFEKSFKSAKPRLYVSAREKANLKNTDGAGGGLRCGGRSVCNSTVTTPTREPCYENPILQGDHEPTIADVPDRTRRWIWKTQPGSGAIWVWDPEAQEWI